MGLPSIFRWLVKHFFKSTTNSDIMSNHFEKLPDELLMMIIKMVIDQQEYRHELLAETIAKISSRFKRLAGDMSLWKGAVKVKKVTGVIDFLNNATKNIVFASSATMTSDEIQKLADKCPNMRSLWYPTIRSWPTLGFPL